MIHDQDCELGLHHPSGPSCWCASRAYNADPLPITDLPGVVDTVDHWEEF